MVTHGTVTVAWVAVSCVLSGVTDVLTFHASVRLFHIMDSVRLDLKDCAAHRHAQFGKLDDGQSVSRGRVQHVEVQEGGEPKSGTGFMYEWTTGALRYSCMNLPRAYGKGSCQIEWDFTGRTLITEPHMDIGESSMPPCHCDGVGRCEKNRLLFVCTALL